MGLRRVLGLVVAGCFSAGLSACAGGGASVFPPPGPPPSISSISPSSATAGAAGFTLTVNGSGFVTGATVLWRGPAHSGDSGTVNVVSGTQLTAQISAADIAVPGPVQVTVSNPSFTKANSNTVTFTINPGTPGILQTVSMGANGATPNGNSHDPAVSVHGEFIAFASEATNLTSPNANFAQGYLRDTCLYTDLCTPATQMVSTVSGGASEGNSLGGASPSLEKDELGIGAVAGFTSTATNLVTPNTKFPQAYARNVIAKTTTLVSVTDKGTEPNGPAIDSMIDGTSGCDAVFMANATDVVTGVSTANQIYWVTACANPAAGFSSPKLVSADSVGNAANMGAQQPVISAQRRFVAFASISTNLPGAPGGGSQQIFLRDTCNHATSCTPSTTMVSVDNAGSALPGSSQVPAVSADGRFVVFTTQAPGTSDVFLRDTCLSSNGAVTGCTASTITISVAVNGGAANGPSSSSRNAISGDGRFVAFSSSATNLITGGNPAAQVFVRDTCNSSSGSIAGCAPRTLLVSVDHTSAALGGLNAAVSDDGHFVAFETTVGGIQQIFLAATGF